MNTKVTGWGRDEVAEMSGWTGWGGRRGLKVMGGRGGLGTAWVETRKWVAHELVSRGWRVERQHIELNQSHAVQTGDTDTRVMSCSERTLNIHKSYCG